MRALRALVAACFGGWVHGFRALAMLMIPLASIGASGAEVASAPICSTIETFAASSEFCRVAPSQKPGGASEITLSLTATTSAVNVAGYRLETDNYNGSYLPPIVELNAGDLLTVRFLNALGIGGNTTPGHTGHVAESITNLHTHGLIVSANNSSSIAKGDGDNIFLQHKRGTAFDYRIRIPKELKASVLDGATGTIDHPTGLYWYHSHLHGVSAQQVTGGMSGLLSVGPRDANLVGQDTGSTEALRQRTDIHYVMLRDIQITSPVAPPLSSGNTPATWQRDQDSKLCGDSMPAPQDRQGYCQNASDPSKLWLFTLNGQRYPTFRLASGRNQLWRVANLSTSVVYLLRIVDEASGSVLPFDILSVDGVVPGKPATPAEAGSPPRQPNAISQTELLLMPAGRFEIYIRNDRGSTTERRYVFTTTGVNTGTNAGLGDHWPEMHLASVIFEPALAAAAAAVGLNIATARPAMILRAEPALVPTLPPGCIRDLMPSELEHRKITFGQIAIDPPIWGIASAILRPRNKNTTQGLDAFDEQPDTRLSRMTFDKYLDPVTHEVKWDGPPKHVCIQLTTGHGQLWQIHNPTDELHNFHLHQSKFRFATAAELRKFAIDPSTLPEFGSQIPSNKGGADAWHDTLPVRPKQRLFLIVNFDAEEQLGRYVFHCHILKHEDVGMMAPIEVLP